MPVEYEALRREMIGNLGFVVEKRFGSSGQFQLPNGWFVTASDIGSFFIDTLSGTTLDRRGIGRRSEIGRLFENQEELDAIHNLSHVFDAALDQPGTETDSALVLSPGWRIVEAAAARALSIMQTSETETA